MTISENITSELRAAARTALEASQKEYDDPEAAPALEGLIFLAQDHHLNLVIRLEHNDGFYVWTIEVGTAGEAAQPLLLARGPSQHDTASAALSDLAVLGLKE